MTQESNQGLLHCRWILYQLNYQRSPDIRVLNTPAIPYLVFRNSSDTISVSALLGPVASVSRKLILAVVLCICLFLQILMLVVCPVTLLLRWIFKKVIVSLPSFFLFVRMGAIAAKLFNCESLNWKSTLFFQRNRFSDIGLLYFISLFFFSDKVFLFILLNLRLHF